MTDASSIPAKQKGGPALIVLLTVIVGPALAAGVLLGAGGASILGGFVAMFSLIATLGGPLRPGLRRLLVVGPLIAFSSVAPRLLAGWSTIAAFTLILLLVFIGGLLPLRGRSYDSVALGLGMGTLLGYSLPLTGTVQAGQLVLAALVGLALAVLLRVLMGASDPTGPTRKAIADVLDGASSDFAAAFDAWSSDRPVRWLGDVLVASGRYRLARRTLESRQRETDTRADPVLTQTADRARALAMVLRSKRPAPLQAPQQDASPMPADELGAAAAGSMRDALDDVQRAIKTRDSTLVAIPAGLRSRVNIAAVWVALRHGSVQVRHAVRTTSAVLLALLVSTRLTHGDPLLPTLLMTTFGLIQVSWRSTLARARDRLLGVLVGGVLVVLIVLLAPSALLLPIALIAMAVGMWFITARPAVGTAGLIVMSVGLNTELRHLDAGQVAIEYVVLTLVALLIGGVLGFVIIPAWRPGPLAARIASAMVASATALTVFSRPETVEHERLDSFDRAQAAGLQLVPDHERLNPSQQHELDQLRSTLQDLLMTALFVASSEQGGSADLALAAQTIERVPQGVEGAPRRPRADSAVVLLAHQAIVQRARLTDALRDGS